MTEQVVGPLVSGLCLGKKKKKRVELLEVKLVETKHKAKEWEMCIYLMEN